MDTEFHKEVSVKFWDSSVCVEHVIWLAGQCYRQSDVFQDFIEMDCEEAESLLGVEIDDETSAECVANEISHTKQGFLVQLSAPIPISFHEHGFTTGGARQLKWFYIDDFSSIADTAVEWAESIVEAHRLTQKAQ